MGSWDLYNEILANKPVSLSNPVEEALKNADFNQPPWEERKIYFQELQKRFGNAFEKDLLKLMKRIDWLYYRYYVLDCYPKFIEEMVILFREQAQAYEGRVQKFLEEKGMFMFQGTQIIPRLAETAGVFRKNLDYFEKLKPQGSLRMEIFNLYSNLLVTNLKHKGGKPLINVNRIENYVRKKQGLDPTEKVDLSHLAKLESSLLLEALDECTSALYLPIDQPTLLWIARFFRNFEVCYELPHRLFNFEEKKHELKGVKDKIIKIVNRCYSEEGIERNLQQKLLRWGVKKIGNKYRYRSSK